MLLMIALGLLAGLITTVVGLGGGMMLAIVLSVIWDPMTAIATTAPALLIGNVQRAYLFREHMELSFTSKAAAFALVGAIVGGLVAVSVPPVLLAWAMVTVAIGAALRELGIIKYKPTQRALLPAIGAAGFVTATSGGGGLLLGPALLAAEIKQERFVVTASMIALAAHLGRLTAYSSGGVMTKQIMIDAAWLGGAILVGNSLGKRLRKYVPEKVSNAMTWGVIILGIGMAVAGTM